MRFIKFALLIPVVLPSLTWGGLIEGTLFKNGQPVADREIRIHCESTVRCFIKFEGDENKCGTNPEGDFSFYVDQPGICTFEVVALGLKHRIYSYQDPVRYDFDLVKQPDSRYLLRRR